MLDCLRSEINKVNSHKTRQDNVEYTNAGYISLSQPFVRCTLRCCRASSAVVHASGQ